MTCLSCHRHVSARARGLCRRCYLDPDVRRRYQPQGRGPDRCAGRSVSRGRDQAEPQSPMLPRQEGEAHYRCLWCFRWRVDGPLRICFDCRVDLRERSVGMPSGVYEDTRVIRSRGRRRET